MGKNDYVGMVKFVVSWVLAVSLNLIAVSPQVIVSVVDANYVIF